MGALALTQRMSDKPDRTFLVLLAFAVAILVLITVAITPDENVREDVLSSAGLEDDDDDIEFVQEDDSEWKPKGQSGIKHQINVLKDKEHKNKLKEDGLKGNHMLSSAGLKGSEDHQDEAEETMFNQQWKPNPLMGAKEGNQDTDTYPQFSAGSDSASEDEEEDEEMDKLSNAALPSDILGASNMDHVNKKQADLPKIGVLTVDDIDI